MPKTVLVICSDNSGKDFPREENQIMLKKLLGDDFIAEFMDRYPQNLPMEHKFDAVLFAGCNVLTWLFSNKFEIGMEKLTNVLKKEGIIIFVENQTYINKIANKSYSLSIPLEEIKLDILKSWEKFFQLDVMDNYFVYKVKATGGGKYKHKKRKSAHKKRKTAYKKRKTAYKKRKTVRKRRLI